MQIERKCKSCGVAFSYEKRRGRPPVKCAGCKVGVRELKTKVGMESTFESGDFKVGDKVVVSAREWAGITLPAYQAKVVGFETDRIGEVLVLQDGYSSDDIRRARPSMTRKI